MHRGLKRHGLVSTQLLALQLCACIAQCSHTKFLSAQLSFTMPIVIPHAHSCEALMTSPELRKDLARASKIFAQELSAAARHAPR